MRGLQSLQGIYNLISALEQWQPLVKADLLSFFRANEKCQIIDSHNTLSVIAIYDDAANKYVVKIECGQDSATARELRWYKYYTLPGVEPVFIEGGVRDHFSYIILKPIDGLVSLADSIFKGMLTKPIIDRVYEALNADQQLFNSTKRFRLPRTQYLDVCNKFEARMNDAAQSPFLKSLIRAESIIINDTVYLSPQKILAYMNSEQEIIEKIFTNDVGVIHGDLHMGNIVYGTTPIDGLFILDPGGVNPLPIQYDGGKILQSIHSGYEQIMRGRYSIHFTGGNAYRLIIENVEDLNTAYDDICDKWDSKFLLGSLFMEAMHFLTMTPHHASNQGEATALYLTGVRRLNEFIDILRSK